MTKAYSSYVPTQRPLALMGSGQAAYAEWWVSPRQPVGRRARPTGVQRPQVFVAITAPNQPASSDTQGETALRFEADLGGTQAHYLTLWVSSSGAWARGAKPNRRRWRRNGYYTSP